MHLQTIEIPRHLTSYTLQVHSSKPNSKLQRQVRAADCICTLKMIQNCLGSAVTRPNHRSWCSNYGIMATENSRKTRCSKNFHSFVFSIQICERGKQETIVPIRNFEHQIIL